MPLLEVLWVQRSKAAWWNSNSLLSHRPSTPIRLGRLTCDGVVGAGAGVTPGAGVTGGNGLGVGVFVGVGVGALVGVGVGVGALVGVGVGVFTLGVGVATFG